MTEYKDFREYGGRGGLLEDPLVWVCAWCEGAEEKCPHPLYACARKRFCSSVETGVRSLTAGTPPSHRRERERRSLHLRAMATAEHSLGVQDDDHSHS